MKILIFDRCASPKGHRIPYAGLVAKSFAGYDVTVALPEQIAGDPILEEHFSPEVTFQFYQLDEQSNPYLVASKGWQAFKQEVKRCQPDAVAIPTADAISTWAGIANIFGLAGVGNVPIVISLMRGHLRSKSNYLSKFVGHLKWWLIERGPWQNILLLDPRSFDDLRDPAGSNILLCPDPAPVQKFTVQLEARKALDLPTEGRIIASIGNQETRKGTDYLLLAFEQAQLQPNDYLILFGKFDATCKQLAEKIRSNKDVSSRIIIRDCFVSDDELQQAVIASDLVATPYRDVDRPSGVISRAVAWNRPIIGTNRGWIKWFVKKYNAGFLTQPENSSLFATDLQKALSSCKQIVSNKACDEFRRFNTEANYLVIWSEAIRTPSKKRP